MSRIYEHFTTVRPEWIDYNGHMQDAYYGLVFSHAVDGFQDAVGFDAAYREKTGCTIYLLEDHKRFLREVHEGAELRVETRLIAFNRKRFLLYSEMFTGETVAAVSEMLEMHVQQRPAPHGTDIPGDIRNTLAEALTPLTDLESLKFRARSLAI